MSELPIGWKAIELGEIAFITKLAGFEYTTHFDYSIGGEIVALRAINVDYGQLNLSDIQTIPRSVSDDLPRSKLHIDDVVLVYVGATIGKVALIERDDAYHLGPNVAKITADANHILAQYLFQFMQSEFYENELKAWTNTTSQPALSMANIRQTKVYLPPHPEQRAIAAILSTWDDAIALTARLIDALKRRKQALMQRLLQERGEMPVGWQWKTLDEFLEQDRTYVTQLEDKLYPRISVKWWAKGAVVDGFDNGKAVKMQRHQLAQPGQIIVSEIWAKHGSIGIIPSDGQDALITSHFFLFDLKPDALIDRAYIHGLVTGNYFMKQADRMSKGTTGYASLRAADFLRFTLPVPAIEVQERIGKLLQTSDQHLALHEQYLNALQTQKRGLMQRLLTGQVRVGS